MDESNLPKKIKWKHFYEMSNSEQNQINQGQPTLKQTVCPQCQENISHYEKLPKPTVSPHVQI